MGQSWGLAGRQSRLKAQGRQQGQYSRQSQAQHVQRPLAGSATQPLYRTFAVATVAQHDACAASG